MKLKTAFQMTAIAVFITSMTGAGAMTAGSYETSAVGIDGDVVLRTTVSQDKIEKIEVVRHKETAGIGTTALETLPERIVKTQSLAVDGVSGATVTSKAVITAVTEALKKAGADISIFLAKPKNADKGKDRVLDTQFVVIGGGGAGQTAAIRANQLGVDTIVLEKQAMMGGAFAMHGGWMLVTGSEVQKQAGVSEDSPNAMVHDFLANGHFKNDLAKLKLYAENVGPTVDWLVKDVGLKFDMKRGLQRQGEYVYDRVLYYEGNTPGIMRTFDAAIKKADNVKIVTSARAEELIVKDGQVVGVKATLADGGKLTVNAKAVLLATGGYGNNKAMLREPVKSALYYGPMCSTGDGFTMAEKIGAATYNMQYGKLYPNGVEVAPGIAKSTIFGNNAALLKGAFIVDKSGKRVVDEKSSNNTILQQLLKDKDRTFYLVMDEPSFEAFRGNVASNMISQNEIDDWLKADGQGTPLLVRGNTLAEAARKAGIDGKALAETVKRYNGFVKAGEDKDFKRPAEYMKQTFDDSKAVYIVEQQPRFATTLGGIRATDEFEVLDTEGKPIRNLFVAGEAINTVHGDDSPIGANAGWAVTSGKLAAEAAANRIEKN